MEDEIENTQQTTPEPAPEPTPQSGIVAEIEAWFSAHFHNSIVSKETDVYNFCHAAKADLIKRLTAL